VGTDPLGDAGGSGGAANDPGCAVAVHWRAVVALKASGDARLAELADTYETNFERYLTSEGLDSREAADDVDITQDRAAQHCVVLGAMTIDEFPTNP
jgi:hypothetical protein